MRVAPVVEHVDLLAAVPSATTCIPSKLALHQKGLLTLATDSPAYPPYFQNNKPSNGQGFESAVAYAVAKKLGFTSSQVKWVVEHFNQSYAPGPKNFDFDINEISITPQRAQEVDFSTPYYTNPQGIIVDSKSPYVHAKTLADLKNAKFGVQIGTTGLEAVTKEINPTQQPDVFNNSNDVVSALKIGRVQAIVTDLATASTDLDGVAAHDDRRAVQRRGGRQLGSPARPSLSPDAMRRLGRERAALQRNADRAQQPLDRVRGERSRPALTLRGQPSVVTA